jgi:hypothetical protein
VSLEQINGKKIRKDGQLLGGSVASIPLEPSLENLQKPEVKQWIKDAHIFFKNEFGDSYKSLVLHLDESKIHIHAYHLAPLNAEDNSVDIDVIHPGYKAQRSVNKKAGRTAKKIAYNTAMRAFQDRYFCQVGLPNGQLRLGPKRLRLTRNEWVSAKNQAQLISSSLNKHKNENIHLRKKIKQLIDYTKNIFTNKNKNKNNTSRENNYE